MQRTPKTGVPVPRRRGEANTTKVRIRVSRGGVGLQQHDGSRRLVLQNERGAAREIRSRVVAGLLERRVSPAKTERLEQACIKMEIRSRAVVRMICDIRPTQAQVQLGARAEARRFASRSPEFPLGAKKECAGPGAAEIGRRRLKHPHRDQYAAFNTFEMTGTRPQELSVKLRASNSAVSWALADTMPARLVNSLDDGFGAFEQTKSPANPAHRMIGLNPMYRFREVPNVVDAQGEAGSITMHNVRNCGLGMAPATFANPYPSCGLEAVAWQYEVVDYIQTSNAAMCAKQVGELKSGWASLQGGNNDGFLTSCCFQRRKLSAVSSIAHTSEVAMRKRRVFADSRIERADYTHQARLSAVGRRRQGAAGEEIRLVIRR